MRAAAGARLGWTVVANCPRYRGGSFVTVSDVGKRLHEQLPDFKPSDYGFTRFHDLLLASGIVEMHKVGTVRLVRLWDDCELGPASKEERDRNVRLMMTGDRGDGKGAPLTSKAEAEHGHEHKPSLAYVSWDSGHKYGTRLMTAEENHRSEEATPSKSNIEHEQARGRDRSLAVVTSEVEDERRTPLALVRKVHGHDDQGHETPLALVNGHVAPSESKDDHSEGQETSPASASPTESDVHEHKRQTPLGSEDEHKVEHETSSAPASSENIQRHEDEQRGNAMPLTLESGSEQEDETTPASQSGPEHEDETSSTSKNEPEQERETCPSPSKTDPEQQGIGMPLTLEFGPEHGDETTPATYSGP